MVLTDAKIMGRVEKKEQKNILPIKEFEKEIKEVIKKNDSAIIVGETGSGKTTQIPLMLLDEIDPKKKIAVTQPRRVAVRSVAKYVAEQAKTRIGDKVGYQVRFEDHTTEGTRINFMTDGILLRKISSDPLLTEYSVVMVDEAHERSLNIDFSLGLLKDIQAKRVAKGLEPLKIIVTSATLEKEKFEKYFDKSPLIEVPGRLFPVDMNYSTENFDDYIQAAAEQTMIVLNKKKDGDILIFMPGQEEIKQTIDKINHNLPPDLKDQVEVLPLYGEMSPEDQDKIFAKTPKRKIIVSTNIAETSVTIDGVAHVIDSGLIKQTNYNPQTGIKTLDCVRHSKSGCKQRAGRAGRTQPGSYWALYSKEDYNERLEHQLPEIKRSNLANVVLQMKQLGIDDIGAFNFIDKPDAGAIEATLTTLKNLGALDENNRLTKLGEIMADLPIEPRYSRMILEAQKFNCVEELVIIVSFLGGRSVFVRPKEKENEADRAHRQFINPTSDFLSLLNVWKQYQAHGYRYEWARDNFLHGKVLEEVRQTQYQLLGILRKHQLLSAKDPVKGDLEQNVAKAVTSGLIDNLMVRYSRFGYKRVTDFSYYTPEIFIHPSSSQFSVRPEILVSGEIVKSSKIFARNNQEVKPEWLIEVAPQVLNCEEAGCNFIPAEDQVVREFKYYLKNQGMYVGKKLEKLTGASAVKAFARYLAEITTTQIFVQNNPEIFEYIENNKKTFDFINKLRLREKKDPLNTNDIVACFVKKLGSIESFEQLKEAQKSGFNLNLSPEDFYTKEQIVEILRNYPDTIDCKGLTLELKYDTYGALTKIPQSLLWKLSEPLKLPNGENISLIVSYGESDDEVIRSGYPEKLKKQIKNKIKERQWSEFLDKNSLPKMDIDLNFVMSGGHLPEPIFFGSDPETGDKFKAYPAVVVSKNYYTDDQYNFQLKYFIDQDKFMEAQRNLDIFRATHREKQEIKMLNEKLQTGLKSLSEKLKNLKKVLSEQRDLDDLLYQLESKLDNIQFWSQNDPKRYYQEYENLLGEVEAIENEVKEKDQMNKKIAAAIEKYFAVCPVCGQALTEKYCVHDLNMRQRIKFEYDEYDRILNQVILSELLTEKGKVVARLVASDGRKFMPGTCFLEIGDDLISPDKWSGEPFEKLEFKDYDKVMSLSEARAFHQERERIKIEKEKKQRWNEYLKNYDYAQQLVKEGELFAGKFKKIKHPKTGLDYWVMTVQKFGMTITYEVADYSHQPTTSAENYFYQIEQELIDTSKVKVYRVVLVEPYPEDRPEGVDFPVENTGISSFAAAFQKANKESKQTSKVEITPAKLKTDKIFTKENLSAEQKEQIKKQLLDEMDLIKFLVSQIPVELQRKPQDKKEIEALKNFLTQIKEKRREFLSAFNSLDLALNSNNPNWESLKGKISSLKNSLKSFFKKKEIRQFFSGRYDMEWIEKFERLRQLVPDAVNTNEMVKDLFSNEGERLEIIKKVKSELNKKAEDFKSGKTVDLNEVINDVLSDILK